jgi:hypothetical protein
VVLVVVRAVAVGQMRQVLLQPQGLVAMAGMVLLFQFLVHL